MLQSAGEKGDVGWGGKAFMMDGGNYNQVLMFEPFSDYVSRWGTQPAQRDLKTRYHSAWPPNKGLDGVTIRGTSNQ